MKPNDPERAYMPKPDTSLPLFDAPTVEKKSRAARPENPVALSMRHRKNKRQLIYEYFRANIGKRFPTMDMHNRFGTGFRARKSDINLDPDSDIIILNETTVHENGERSVYWAEVRVRPATPTEANGIR